MTQAAQLAAQAAQWQTAGRPDMAAQLYAASLEQDPSNVMARWQLADCLTYLQQPDQAAMHYLQVAQSHALMGRQTECLGVCERVIQIAPHAFVYTAVGPTVRRIGRTARTVCARAAEAHLRAGRQTEGLQILRLGAELDATSPEVRLQLARIYKSRSMTREAVEAMADAGDLLLQTSRFAEYAKVAELLLTLDPDHLDTLRELPRAYIELRRPHDAVRMLGQLTRVSPGDIVGYEILAQAFAFIGHTDKALSVLERLLDELSSIGRSNKADAILEHARQWRPNDLGFMRALKRMEIPKPASTRAPAPAPRDMPPEGTVVLNIADLMADQSLKGPAPSSDGIELTEVEGTLSLDLGDLMRHERQQAADQGGHGGVVATEQLPAPAPQAPIPGPDDVEISMSLDASALIEALANDVPLHEIAKLVYDEDGDDGSDDDGNRGDDEPATQLAMKPLTAEDIARTQRGVPAKAPPPLRAPVRATPPPPPPPRPAPAAPPPPPALVASPPLPAPVASPPLPAPVAPPQDEDAPTMAHMQALTSADIAKALARPGGGAPPPRAPMRSSFDEEITLTPRAKEEPQPPPLLPPQAHTLPNDDEDAMTLAKMEALTPEDIARALRKQRNDDG